MTTPRRGLLFNFTHVENLPSIIEHGLRRPATSPTGWSAAWQSSWSTSGDRSRRSSGSRCARERCKPEWRSALTRSTVRRPSVSEPTGTSEEVLMVRTAHGDLLSAETDALVNTVNTVGVMGKGIALQFKKRFPGNFKAYAAA